MAFDFLYLDEDGPFILHSHVHGLMSSLFGDSAYFQELQVVEGKMNYYQFAGPPRSGTCLLSIRVTFGG